MLRFLAVLSAITLLAIIGIAVAAALWHPPGEVMTPAGIARNTSTYIDTPDGTRIAADIWLPADASAPIPVVLEGTRYWRAMGLTAVGRIAAMFGVAVPDTGPDRWVTYFNDKGYAYVRVDVRGTGASSGVHVTEYAPDEVEDFRAVLDWIAGQPWSTGQVFTIGVSYSGTLAELVTRLDHPALIAAAPLYSDFDAQMQLATPGGVMQPAFISRWSDLVAAMDRNDVCGVIAASEARVVPENECTGVRLITGGVKPVQGQDEVLEQHIAQHNSPNVVELVKKLEYRDSPWAGGLTSLHNQVFAQKQAIESASVPLFVITGWFDAATTSGALARFVSFSNPQSVWIAPFDHGGNFDTDPFVDAPPVWSATEQLDQVEAFFRQHLEGHPWTDKVLHYYVMGAREFRTTHQWPPEHLTDTLFYFADAGALSPESPPLTDHDVYQVDFDTGTAPSSRWITQLGGLDVDYRDNPAQGLAYVSEPMQQDTELTGSPVLDLWMTSTRDDGALHVYLEALAPTGEAFYLTEGVLRLIHRAITEEPVYPHFGPAHSFLKRDAKPLPQGRIVRISTTLLATSARVPKDYRLRLRLTGADSASFARYPADGEAPTWHVYRGPTRPSSLTVPMAPYVADSQPVSAP
ncbi:MAG: CocE/NonD family hydrolase [Pseudomonadales bacterium]|nr:CocE/NonD family hydrolase [Pseudomonadales bacterium]MCP5185534.1 CocE/NonD family hydrolase [Pseudomonadales bacterium]